MKNININDKNSLLTLLFMSTDSVVDGVCDTNNWLKDGIIQCKVSFNGVEVPAEEFEKVLDEWVKSIESHFNEKYDAQNFDNRVEERANQIIKQHADGILESMANLQHVLSESEDLITPYWKRES